MDRALRIFIGYDGRQAISYNVLQHSILHHSSKPVMITPLTLHQLPLERQGLTPFTYSRYLVPWLCQYEGWALFVDADMLFLHDVAKLFDLADPNFAVMVVKNKITYEWSSVMLMNCARCKLLTPEYVSTADQLSTFNWLKEEEIGALPARWNHLVGYDEPNPDRSLVHFTQGIPAFPELWGCEYSQEWLQEHRRINSFGEWSSIFSASTHCKWFVRGMLPKLVDNRKRARLRSWLWYGLNRSVRNKTFTLKPSKNTFADAER